MELDTLEWLLERSIESYDTEGKHTDKIRERISFILSLAITPCFAIAAYLISSLRGNIFSELNIYIFWIPLALAIAILLASIGHVAYVLLWPFKYERPPSPLEILKYVNAHPDPKLVLVDAQIGLLHEIALSVDHNFKTNQHRKLKLVIAQRLAFFAFLLLIFTCTPRWAYVFINTEPKAQSIKIISPVQVTQESKMTQQTQKQSTSPQQPTASDTQEQQQATSQLNTQQAKPDFPKRTIVFDSGANFSTQKPEFPQRTLAAESESVGKNTKKPSE